MSTKTAEESKGTRRGIPAGRSAEAPALASPVEALTQAVHGMEFALRDLRDAHSRASRCAQIETLRLIGEQAELLNRAKYLLECVEGDAANHGDTEARR